MKHVIRLICVALLPLLVLVSCGGPSTPATQPNKSASATLVWRSPPSATTGLVTTGTPERLSMPPWFASHTRPAVANGLIFLTVEASEAASLYALDAATGSYRWHYRPEVCCSRSVSSPTTAGNFVLFSSFMMTWGSEGYNEPSGFLYAVDANTGKERWRYQADATVTTPIVSGSTIYLCSTTITSDDSQAIQQNKVIQANAIQALDLATGALLWKLPLNDTSIVDPPTLADGVLYFAGLEESDIEQSYLYAVDIAARKETWRFALDKGRYSLGAPAVGNGLVYVTNHGDKFHFLGDDYSAGHLADGDQLHALDAETGVSKWSYSVGPPISASPVYTSPLYAAPKPGIFSSPLTYGDMVIVAINSDPKGDSYGLGNDIQLYILALDAKTGKERWRYKSEYGAVSPASAVHTVELHSTDDRILFGYMNSHHLHALDAKTGQLRWKFETGDSAVGLPASAKGLIYLVDYDGALYVLRPPP